MNHPNVIPKNLKVDKVSKNPKKKHPTVHLSSSKHLLGEPGTGRLFQASGLWKPVKDRRIDRRPMADRTDRPKVGGPL